MNTATQLISRFSLLPHPEGGWYKETYRSTEGIPHRGLPIRFNGDRHFSTAIYFLLEKGTFSAFHKIKSDECWHFYAGQSLEIFVLDKEGELVIVKLGNDITNGEVFQYVVPANTWFASRPSSVAEYAFVGCTVSPGFDFADFELAESSTLSNEFPQHTHLIKELCRL